MRSTFFTTLLTTVTVALAGVADVKRAPIVDKRQGPIVMFFACTDPNLTGDCHTFGATTCTPLTGTPYVDDLSSVVSTTSSYSCNLFTTTDCTGSSFFVGNTVQTNQLPAPFDNAVASYVCAKTA